MQQKFQGKEINILANQGGDFSTVLMRGSGL